MGNISPTFISGRVCPLNAHPCRGLAGDIPAGDVSSAQPALPRARDVPLGHSRARVPEPAGTAPDVTSRSKGEGSRQRRPGAAELHPARGCGAVRGCSQPPLEGSRTALPGDRSSPGRRNVPRHPREPRGHREQHQRHTVPGQRDRPARPHPAGSGRGTAEPAAGSGGEGKGCGGSPGARPRSPSMFSRSLMCCRLQPVSSRLSSASGR